MNKKEYIMILLEKLSDTRELADGLKMIISQSNLSEDVIEGLYKIISHAVNSVDDKFKKEKLTKGLSLIQEIAKAEAQEEQGLEQELDKLLSQI